MPHVISDNITAGYINDSVINDLKKFGGLENIKNIVYVDASYSSKKINVNNTFIKLRHNVLAPVSEIPLLADRVSKVGNTNQYFYLYFETATTNSQEVKKEIELLSNALVHILKTNIKNV